MSERRGGLVKDLDMAGWPVLIDRLATTLEALRPGTFVIVEYDKLVPWAPRPYAQCAREVDGWYCEVVSETYLGREAWPIDELALRRGGWLMPDEETLNWWQGADTSRTAAERIVQGLRAGRRCPDPDAFRCRSGRFPSGPDGGEPLPLLSEHWEFVAA